MEFLSAVRLIEDLLEEARACSASDIHLSPARDHLAIRFRINGALADRHRLPLRAHRELIARLKILADLRIDEHHAPQDGRFTFSFDDAYAGERSMRLDVRVSLTPTHYGEQAVLRLLFPREELATLEDLGFSEQHQELIQGALERARGLILVTGPTGSGKTTTLYTLLRLLNQRTVSIITIEDPIEYSLEGISQIPVHGPGRFGMVEGLRSIMRQDPNIIGIGEIRDQETALLATHAALTGHLVLSTLHTLDAPTALLRLIDLGIEPYLVASTVELVIAQRLVRQRDADGRAGIFEVLGMDQRLRELTSEKASGFELLAHARGHGFTSLFEDAQKKAAAGLIEPSELAAYAYE